MSENNKIVAFPNRAELDAVAAAWLTRLDRDEVSTEDHLAFRTWMAESEHHKAAFDRIAKFWFLSLRIFCLNHIQRRLPDKI